MADFSSFSSPYKSQVDQILAEAMDQCVLEQVSAINCSSFSHSVLPSHIENRFQKLKTFPSSKPQLAFHSVKDLRSSGGGEGKFGTSHSKVSNFNGNSVCKEGKMVNSSSGQSKASIFKGNSDSGEGKMGISPPGQSKVSNFEGSSSRNLDSFEFKGGKHCGKGKIVNSQTGSGSFCSDSEEETAKKTGGGCFCFSPKRVSRKKSGGENGRNVDGKLGFGLGKNEEVLSDLRAFSSKEMKKRMKEATEEKKVNNEAKKIVKWAKQVYARIDVDISDNDDL